MLKSILLTVMAFGFAVPSVANEDLGSQLKPCIDTEIQHRTRPVVTSVNVIERVEHMGKDYYYIVAEAEKYPWGFYLELHNGVCSAHASEFVAPIDAIESLPEQVALKFIRNRYTKRIDEVGFQNLKNEFEKYQENLSAKEKQVAKEMNLL